MYLIVNTYKTNKNNRKNINDQHVSYGNHLQMVNSLTDNPFANILTFIKNNKNQNSKSIFCTASLCIRATNSSVLVVVASVQKDKDGDKHQRTLLI
jgi:hypothetical protein